MSGVRISHLGPECVDERCSTENTAQKRGVFTYLSVFSLQKVRKWDFSTSRSPRACSSRWGWTLERKRRSNMAVRRLKGLYLKSEGKYLEDYPSCYVEQTEALLNGGRAHRSRISNFIRELRSFPACSGICFWTRMQSRMLSCLKTLRSFLPQRLHRPSRF